MCDPTNQWKEINGPQTASSSCIQRNPAIVNLQFFSLLKREKKLKNALPFKSEHNQVRLKIVALHPSDAQRSLKSKFDIFTFVVQTLFTQDLFVDRNWMRSWSIQFASDLNVYRVRSRGQGSLQTGSGGERQHSTADSKQPQPRIQYEGRIHFPATAPHILPFSYHYPYHYP